MLTTVLTVESRNVQNLACTVLFMAGLRCESISVGSLVMPEVFKAVGRVARTRHLEDVMAHGPTNRHKSQVEQSSLVVVKVSHWSEIWFRVVTNSRQERCRSMAANTAALTESGR